MIDPDTYTCCVIESSSAEDLRRPDIDETPLSGEEVRHGVVRGIIPQGPRAHAHAFAEVTVVQRRLVEVWQIGEAA